MTAPLRQPTAPTTKEIGAEEDGAARLLAAALRQFVEKGFHGTSMRDIAREAGASVSHAYYYFPSKGAILYRLVADVTAALANELEAVDRSSGPDPAARLVAVVRAHVLFHTARQAESFVGNTELRSLSEAERAAVVADRDRVTRSFRRPIDAGVATGQFDCAAPAETTRAIVSMTTAVASWHRPDGPLTPAEIADRYAAIALRMVGAPTLS